jgi:hypothetical protein
MTGPSFALGEEGRGAVSARDARRMKVERPESFRGDPIPSSRFPQRGGSIRRT